MLLLIVYESNQIKSTLYDTSRSANNSQLYDVYISIIRKYILESFSECTDISNVVKVGWKSVQSGWTGVEEATFSKFSSCSWQMVSR